MAEIDLIPSDYRLAQRRDRALHTLARAAGALLVTGIAAAGSLAYAASRVHAELDELTLAQRLSEQQRTELEHLDAERIRLEQQLQRLEALRGGGDIGALFRLIDRTLPTGELWFERWELLRTGEEGRPGGAAVATPAAAAAATPPSTAVAGRQMRIFGQARDHEALSRFVRELYESPEVEDVHLERTALRRYTTTSVVAFELAVALKDAA